MAAFQKFNSFVQNLANGSVNLATDTLKIMLTNTAPSPSANALYGDVSGTETVNGNGYTTGGLAVTGQASSQTSGVEALTGTGVTWTASGAMGAFRYAILYDTTPTSPLKPLVGYWDYGSSLSLTAGQTFAISLSSGILQVS
jgi:hypothetical protein